MAEATADGSLSVGATTTTTAAALPSSISVTVENGESLVSPTSTTSSVNVMAPNNAASPVEASSSGAHHGLLSHQHPVSITAFGGTTTTSSVNHTTTAIPPHAPNNIASRTSVVSSTTTTTSSTRPRAATAAPAPSATPSSSEVVTEVTAQTCCICGHGNENGNRRLVHFRPTAEAPDDILLHVFCGKTAAILPHVNRPDLEILTKAGIKNKHGTGVAVTMALQRCRSAKVDDPSGREQEYFLSKEFERIYLALTKEPPAMPPPPPPPLINGDENLQLQGLVAGTEDEILPNAIYSTAPPDYQHHHHHHPAYVTHHHPHHHASALPSVTPEQQPQPEPTADFSPHEPLVTSSGISYTEPQPQQQEQQQAHDHVAEPPFKKLRTDVPDAALPSTSATQTGPKSPYDVEMERLQAVCDRCNGVGYSLVRGVAGEDGATATINTDESFDPSRCSQSQVDHVRVIVISKERQDRMDQMGRLILGDQFGAELMHLTTAYSYAVLNAWNEFTRLFHAAHNYREKFDLLLGFTHTIKEHDVWMRDHDEGQWGGDDMVRQLALSWNHVLSKTDDELGIDSEYTRPGTIALLEQLKETLERQSPPMPFQFQEG